MPERPREGSGVDPMCRHRTGVDAAHAMAQSRTTEVERMRERLKQGGYDVDPRLVAAAILERLSAGGVAPGDRKPPPSA